MHLDPRLRLRGGSWHYGSTMNVGPPPGAKRLDTHLSQAGWARRLSARLLREPAGGPRSLDWAYRSFAARAADELARIDDALSSAVADVLDRDLSRCDVESGAVLDQLGVLGEFRVFDAAVL